MRYGPLGKVTGKVLALFVFLASAGTGISAPVKFVLAADDSYGVDNCLLTGGDCGQTVADAWCEAHGQGNAIAFGLLPANLNEGATIRGSFAGLQITCGD